jgi:hypothetical protein
VRDQRAAAGLTEFHGLWGGITASQRRPATRKAGVRCRLTEATPTLRDVRRQLRAHGRSYRATGPMLQPCLSRRHSFSWP